MTRNGLYRQTSFPAALRDLEDHLNRVFREDRSQTAPWRPEIDLVETADAYVIHADLPGVTRENIDIEVDGDTIALRGERAREELADGASHRHLERGHGRFERVLRVPERSIDPEGVAAQYRNGVLTVTLPKRAEAKRREIPVSFE